MTTAPVTPDGRYIVVRARLWRGANPNLSAERRDRLVAHLMDARRAVRAAKRAERDGEPTASTDLAAARAAVDAAKVALGERGPVWWTDGTPDHNRRLALRGLVRGPQRRGTRTSMTCTPAGRIPPAEAAPP